MAFSRNRLKPGILPMISILLATWLVTPALPSSSMAGQDPSQAEASVEMDAHERAFEQLLSGAVLEGRFTDDAKSGAPPEPDRYTLGRVSKVGGSAWRFETRIEYGGGSFTVPLVLDVLWAGDTPVITLTDKKIPLLGTFSARVLFHGDRYVGTWQGASHGGEMWGVVERPEVEVAVSDQNWPSFRGAGASGSLPGFETAVNWDVDAGEGVRWKTPIPGLAHSSPVIWGDRLFVTSAVREGEESELKVGLYGDIGSVEGEGDHAMKVFCLDKGTGSLLWERTAWTGEPKIMRHPKGSHAASTPATDGEHVVALFASEGLYCYDMQGTPLWSRDLGTLDSGYYVVKTAQWGFASSPVIHDGKVIVQCDLQGDSFLTALDVEGGEELWRTARDEVPTWGTPTVDVREGRSQIICNGYKHTGSYDLESGEPLWWIQGGGDVPVPTPVVAHDLIYITSAHGRLAPIYAVDAMAKGEFDLTHEHVAWSDTRRGNYMQTPIVVGDLLFLCHDAGILTCRDARTGEVHYRERLGGGGAAGFTASGVAADGKIYVTSEDGEVYVVAASSEFKLLATNVMGETCMATPAISEGVIYWRTRGHVTAIER